RFAHVAARVAAAAASVAALRLGAEPGEPVRIDARTAHAAAPLRTGSPRTVRDAVRDARVAGQYWRHPRLAPAGQRAALGRRADPARRVSDRRVADPRGASLGGAAAGGARRAMARLLERDLLAARPGLRPVDGVESRAGDPRVRSASPVHRAGLRLRHARLLRAGGRATLSRVMRGLRAAPLSAAGPRAASDRAGAASPGPRPLRRA